MSADTDLRDALIEAFRRADSCGPGGVQFIETDHHGAPLVRYDRFADVALSVIGQWTVPGPPVEDEPQSFKQVREIVRQELVRHKLIIAADSVA